MMTTTGSTTGMYGAAECFAYAATGDPKAKERATAAFGSAALSVGGDRREGRRRALPGFVARTILPTSGPNPNEQHSYTPEGDMERRKGDALWKVLTPRWPVSADGKWYWKSDTSSDELDGHFFLYAQYYDHVAETEEEKHRVREVVRGLADHLIAHDFRLVDWDGTPTAMGQLQPGVAES